MIERVEHIMNNKWQKQKQVFKEGLIENHSYPQIYLYRFAKRMFGVFTYPYDCGCNVFFTLDNFLNGSAYNDIYERVNPRYLNMSPLQLLETVSYDDKIDWESTKRDKNDRLDKYELGWTGKVLALFQWKYRIQFRDWLHYFSSQDIFNMFYPLHEASTEHAADVLKRNYDYARKHNILKENKHLVKRYKVIEWESNIKG